MSLAGKGAVAIWHDIAHEGRNAFYEWHGREHMPERAGIPGFLRGRRYVAIDGAPEYFNLYETVSRFTVTGADYLRRLNAPTPWTVETIRHFRNVSRSLCEVAASYGEGQGGLVATLRYDVAESQAVAHRQRLGRETLAAFAESRGVAGCHLLIADAAASAVDTAERRARAEQNLIPRWIVLVESWDDVDAFRKIAAEMAAHPALVDAIEPPVLGIYRLQNSRVQLPWTAG